MNVGEPGSLPSPPPPTIAPADSLCFPFSLRLFGSVLRFPFLLPLHRPSPLAQSSFIRSFPIRNCCESSHSFIAFVALSFCVLPPFIPFIFPAFFYKIFIYTASVCFILTLFSNMSVPETHSSTPEQLPKLPSELQSEVAQRAGLKHVKTLEKNVLPTKEDLEEERKHENFKKGIQNFDAHKLRHVETESKCVLPSSGDIAKEKTPQLAAEFDHAGLKHVETTVKTGVEVIDEADQKQQ